MGLWVLVPQAAPPPSPTDLPALLQISIFYLPSADAIKAEASRYAWYFFAIASGALVCYVAQVCTQFCFCPSCCIALQR
jgi:hypothetical protein